MADPRPERLDPKNDVVFRLLFSEERLLVPLLEAVLAPPSPIRSAVVHNSELPKDAFDDKSSYLDILLTLDDGTLVDVEMQCARHAAFAERALYYWASVYAGQLSSGDDYRRLVPVISILLLDFRFLPTEGYHEVFRLSGEVGGTVYSEHCRIHTLELPKVPPDAAANSALQRWCRFFSSEDPLEVAELAEHDPGIAMAEERLAELSADPAVRELARWRHRNEMGRRIELSGAREEGRTEGFRELLEIMLTQRFGPLGERERARLEHASARELTDLGERLFRAASLDELFV